MNIIKLIKKYLLIKALVIFVASIFVFYFFPDFSRISLLLLIFSALLAISHIIINRKTFFNFFKINRAQRGMNAIISFVLFLLIVLVLNFVFSKYDLNHDFTKNKINSLSEQTQNVLKNLKNDIKIIAFVPSMQNEAVKNVIDKYSYYTNKIKLEIIDPAKEPLKTKNYGVEKNNVFVIESVATTTKLEDNLSEENLTNAIIKTTRTEKKKIYFISGHGEKSISDQGAEGFSSIKTKLEGQNYDVEELSLISSGEVPAMANLIIIAGAKKPFFDKEKELLSKYKTEGKAMIVLADPLLENGQVSKSKNLDFIFENSGIIPDWNLIVDPSPALFGASATMPVVSEYEPACKITSSFNDKTFFPNSQSLTINIVDKITVTNLCKTTDRSWGEYDIKGGKVAYNPGVDKIGPLTICALSEGQDDLKLNLLVVGDSDFIVNQNVEYVGNKDLFINMVSYLLKDEDLVSVRAKDEELTMFSVGQGKMRLLAFLTMYFIPLAVLISGIIFWYRRRKL